MAAEYSVILTTTASREDAREIARGLLEVKAAACVQILPIESLYTWQGKVAQEEEVLLLVKTRTSLYSEVEETIKRLHKYETPEILQLPVGAGLPEYLNWVNEVTKT